MVCLNQKVLVAKYEELLSSAQNANQKWWPENFSMWPQNDLDNI